MRACIVPVHGFFPKALSKALRRELYLRKRKCKALTDQWMKHLPKGSSLCRTVTAIQCCKKCLWSVSQKVSTVQGCVWNQIIECRSCHQVFGCRAVNPEREHDPLDSIKSVQGNELDWIGVGGQEIPIHPGISYIYIDTLKRDPRKHLRCSRRTLQCLAATARQKFPQTLQWQPAKHCHTSHPMSQRYSLWQLWFQPRLRSNDCCYSNAQKQYVFRVSA